MLLKVNLTFSLHILISKPPKKCMPVVFQNHPLPGPNQVVFLVEFHEFHVDFSRLIENRADLFN